MRKHGWREDPRHDIVGRPNDTFPSVALMCGHVDTLERTVCLVEEGSHRSWEMLSAPLSSTYDTADMAG